jgi:hypothetical protein
MDCWHELTFQTPCYTMVSTLSMRLSPGGEENKLRFSKDGADFLVCDGPQVLGQQLLFSFHWAGDSGVSVIFDSGQV